ncbi:MAG TPA: sodium:proton antiporter [Thermopetrobacter sp.]|nr:sodium:proton antiporter [Thermopetrobacter sp.]
MTRLTGLVAALLVTLLPVSALAGEGATQGARLDLTSSPFGVAALVIFVLAYLLVVFEEGIHMRKSKPVMLAAGLIWALIGIAYMGSDKQQLVAEAAQHNMLEYGELFLFLFVAITYVNSMNERGVFTALREWLINQGFGYRKLFWITGVLAFFLSPLIDNLTTSLVLGAVVLAVGANNPKFVALACINVVVAANAGGAFSPFGDITTLMVWQKNKLEFFEFFAIFIPSVINYLVPAALMSLAVPNETPAPNPVRVGMKPGAKVVISLFVLTIVTAVSFRNFLSLPPALGMMTGLGYLAIFSYLFKLWVWRKRPGSEEDIILDAFRVMERVEWDTLLFFFGVIFAVGGLGVIGYLAMMSQALYVEMGPTIANTLIGILSAIVDNIPLMFAVLTMNPAMSDGQWLLITLTAGVGGSLLSVGSAAGVALMGLARGQYTFFSHLKWVWAIALGYFASIAGHLWLNAALFK